MDKSPFLSDTTPPPPPPPPKPPSNSCSRRASLSVAEYPSSPTSSASASSTFTRACSDPHGTSASLPPGFPFSSYFFCLRGSCFYHRDCLWSFQAYRPSLFRPIQRSYFDLLVLMGTRTSYETSF